MAGADCKEAHDSQRHQQEAIHSVSIFHGGLFARDPFENIFYGIRGDITSGSQHQSSSIPGISVRTLNDLF
jgi:hypothetical protein